MPKRGQLLKHQDALDEAVRDYLLDAGNDKERLDIEITRLEKDIEREDREQDRIVKALRKKALTAKLEAEMRKSEARMRDLEMQLDGARQNRQEIELTTPDIEHVQHVICSLTGFNGVMPSKWTTEGKRALIEAVFSRGRGQFGIRHLSEGRDS